MESQGTEEYVPNVNLRRNLKEMEVSNLGLPDKSSKAMVLKCSLWNWGEEWKNTMRTSTKRQEKYKKESTK